MYGIMIPPRAQVQQFRATPNPHTHSHSFVGIGVCPDEAHPYRYGNNGRNHRTLKYRARMAYSYRNGAAHRAVALDLMLRTFMNSPDFQPYNPKMWDGIAKMIPGISPQQVSLARGA